MMLQAAPYAGPLLADLRVAIAAAAADGATYPWIAGVLAGCLAADTTAAEARTVAIHTLRLAAVSPGPQRVG